MPPRLLRTLLATSLAVGAVAAGGAAGACAQSVIPGGKVPIKVFQSARTGAAAVLVPIRIGSRTGYFILDTGAQKSMIDSRIARHLGLRQIGRKRVLCGITGCGRPTRPVDVPNWSIGGITLPPTHLSQGTILALFPGPTLAAGLLGADMLSAYGKINIDFANSLLTLGDGTPIAPSAPGTPTPAPGTPAPSPTSPGSGLVAH